MIEGGLPLAGARAQIYVGFGKKRRPLPNPGSTSRTTAGGAVILHPKRLPHRFEVVVRGGSIDGRPFKGWISTRVRRYTGGGIVTVNPVTTLINNYKRTHPRMKLSAAYKRVRRYLEIPSVSSVSIDLRRSDAAFDGNVFLERLGGRSESELIRSTLKRLDRTSTKGTDPFVHSGQDTRVGVTSAVASAGEAAAAEGIFDDLAKSLIDGAGGEAGSTGMGFLLDVLGVPGADSDLGEITSQLAAIGVQLNELEVQESETQAAIANLEYTTLFALIQPTLGKIDLGENCLSYMLTLSSADRPDFAKRVSAYIGGTLDVAENDLVDALASQGRKAGIIEASYSDTLAQAKAGAIDNNSHFWNHEVSEQPRQILDYFAAYQAELALLWTEHENYSGKPIDEISMVNNGIQADVAAGKLSLKTEVPAEATVDLNTGRVWYLKAHVPCETIPGSNGTTFIVSGHIEGPPGYWGQPPGTASPNFSCSSMVPKTQRDYFLGQAQSGPNTNGPPGSTYTMLEYVPPFVLPDLPNAKFRVPDIDEMSTLFNGWDKPVPKPATPLAFLQTYGGFATDYWIYPVKGSMTDQTYTTPVFWAYDRHPPSDSYNQGKDCSYWDGNWGGGFDECRFVIPGHKGWFGATTDVLSGSETDEFMVNIMWTADASLGEFWYLN